MPLEVKALRDPNKSRKTTTTTILRQQGGQAHKHRYSNLSLMRVNLKQPRALCSESPSRSPRTAGSQHRWRQLNRKEILRGKRHPKKQQRWTARKTHDDQEPRTCRSARQYAHAEAPRPALVLPNPTARQGPRATKSPSGPPDLREAKSPLLRKPFPLPEVLQANTVKLNDEGIRAERRA